MIGFSSALGSLLQVSLLFACIDIETPTKLLALHKSYTQLVGFEPSIRLT